MAVVPIHVKGTPENFRVLYNRPPGVDTVIVIGGRGGKKTYEVSKFGAVDAIKNRRRVALLRDEKETIRESILQEIFNRYDTANRNGQLDALFDKIETGIRDKSTGNMLVFTKGFRASSLEKRTNLKGMSDTDTAIIEEAEDIRDFNKFSTFKDSVRTQDRLIIIILNTPDIQHWIIKRYFNLEEVTLEDLPECPHLRQDDIDGYWKLIPKSLPGFIAIQSNYTDNEHLPEGVIRDYQSYGQPESTMYDLHYYLTAIKGFASSGRKGQVLKKVKTCTDEEYKAIDAREILGLDFGTSSPAGIVGVKIWKNNLYARQLNYKPLDTFGILKFFCEKNIGADDLIIADSADPISIGKIRRGWPSEDLTEDDIIKWPRLTKGFNIRGAMKGPGSIEAGLGILTSMNLFFCESSTDLWNETFNYVYAQDKSGEYTNIPEDSFNHLIDPIRYVAQARGRLF